LVGFLEAEAHFHVRPNNGGANWLCGVSVAVRDDDADVLMALWQRTGLGRVRPVDAVRNSKAQARWTVDSKAGAAQIAGWCREFPMAGRRRAVAEEWARAVELWAPTPRGTPADVWHAVAAHAERLRELRKYTERRQPVELDMSDDLFRAWLGGFFSGEGCLMLEPTRARLAIHLRQDDRPLLEALQSRTRIGAIYDSPASGTSAPASVWSVFSRADLSRAVDLLSQTELRGRKARQFAAWRRAIEVLVTRGHGSQFTTARRAFLQTSRYVPATTTPYTSCAIALAHEAYAEALREWAAEKVGPLTCTAYDAARRMHPEWPARNTLLMNFGSWAEALDAAGLRHRAHARSAA
jgi:hypothetical protein